MSLIPALGRQRQGDLCEFEASLVYILSSRTARTTLKKKSCLKKEEEEKEEEEKEKER